MKAFQLTLSFFLFCLLGYAQKTATSQQIPLEIKEHMQQRVDAQVNVGIATAYINGDHVDYHFVGSTDLNGQSPITKESIFEIGSITKTFAGILLADQILNGQMALDDPISKYLPEDVKVPTRSGKEITLKDIITHSSGLSRLPDNMNPEDPSNPYADYTVEQMYDFLARYELPRDIGESYEYSNLAMGLFGHLLSLHTSKSFEELVVEKIAKPLGMDDTRINLSNTMQQHLAKGHSGFREVSNWDMPTLAAAGGLRSSTEDMVTYVKANLGVIDSPIYDAMKMSHNVLFKNEGADMGMAWHQVTRDGVTYVNHGGGTGGYRTFIAFIKGSDKGVVVMSNSDDDISNIGRKLLDTRVELQMPKTPISHLIKTEIETNGIDAAISKTRKLFKEKSQDYNFDESIINAQAYNYLRQDQNDIALKLFKLNVEFYPSSSNPYDSLGEAYMKVTDTASAIKNYKESLKLNPGNANAATILKKLNVDVTELVKEVTLSQDVLKEYVGSYQLAPNFILTVTTADGKLMAQATGQGKFEIFPSAKDKFYLKVVEARIEFNRDDAETVTSLTLFQNGAVMEAKKME